MTDSARNKAAWNKAIDASFELRRTLRAAGISGLGPELDLEAPDDRPVMDLEYLGGPDAALLTDLLCAGSGMAAERAIPPRLTAWSMPDEDIIAVRNSLHGVLASEGIGGLTEVEESLRAGQRSPVMYINIKGLDADAASKLTSLLAAAMREHFSTAMALHSAARAQNLDNDDPPFPLPTVHGLRIHLGDISVRTALDLGTILGAGPWLTKLEAVPDFPESTRVMNRLDQALKATIKGFVNLQFNPYCRKCEHDPSITLGDLNLDEAKRLVAALQPGAVTTPLHHSGRPASARLAESTPAGGQP